MKRQTALFFTVLMIGTLLFAEKQSRAASLIASKAKIQKGSTIRIDLYFYYGKEKPKWSTSNKKVKIISKGKKWCKIKAKKTGAVYVKCKIGKKTYKKKITIKAKSKITYSNYKKIKIGMDRFDVNLILGDDEEVDYSRSHTDEEFMDYADMQQEYGGWDDECYLEQTRYVWRNPWTNHYIYCTFNDWILIKKEHF